MKTEKIDNLLKKFNTIPMYRVEWGTWRIYAVTDPVKLYSGLTGALENVTFKGNLDNRQLDGWRKTMIDNFGRQQQEGYVQATADFGTLCHEVLVRIHNEGKLNWAFEYEYAEKYFEQSAISNGMIPNKNIIDKQVFEFCKTAAALMVFVHENVEEIYAIEGMCKSDEYEIATPIDMVCKLKDGQIVTINLKTSSQLNDKHREQCVMEKYMWNLTYPDLQADRTALLRSKDWNLKKVPTYEFELIDEGKMLENVLSRLKIAKSSPKDTYLKFPREQVMFVGETSFGEVPKMETKKIEEILFKTYAEA